ncbi:terpenoid cyclases/protein prenyltransferase alpha-alpha toroid [Gaertneriomyces semiglobifer]|nr:terpenoid cyclases/protein prenyltransferase alpha-alpha toroid [Gaertneriomyces semiglobifer]
MSAEELPPHTGFVNVFQAGSTASSTGLLDEFRRCDDEHPSDTSLDQTEVEESVIERYQSYLGITPSKRYERIKLYRPFHAAYLLRGLESLSKWMVSLDASRPWLVYWMIHSLDLLNVPIPDEIAQRAIDTLSRCQNPEGGFGGGPGQLSHVAATYAAVHALALIGRREAWDAIDRKALIRFYSSLLLPNGSFLMHRDGEADVRGIYCVLSVCSLLNILGDLLLLRPNLEDTIAAYLARCQTFEGGLGGQPGTEAHGGYTFCGTAALWILGRTHEMDLELMTDWVVRRQMPLEGGFQGRQNKLVDGCYSFWVGALDPILSCAKAKKRGEAQDQGASKAEPMSVQDEVTDRFALQKYILLACQNHKGGFKDKPSKSPDYYHTCYVLSGLSISQRHYKYTVNEWLEDDIALDTEKGLPENVLGVPDNLLQPTHPIYNLRLDKARSVKTYFRELDDKQVEVVV